MKFTQRDLPKHFTVCIEEDEVLVRFDYWEGEEQWFDARAGVGSPGCPPELTITEVKFPGSEWAPVEQYPQINLDAVEDAVMQQINDCFDALAEQWAERESTL